MYETAVNDIHPVLTIRERLQNLADENSKLREQPPYDELVETLRRDWDIEASWDGLRRFWYVDLTDEGVRKRDEREVTLWRGTCHDKNGFDRQTGFECTDCGTMVNEYMVTPFDTGHEVQFRYCPNCGRKVVADG